MQVHEVKSPKGSRKSKRILGRGRGSGAGKTAGRGENGQRSRGGRWASKGSEGGQMRLIRRLPKVGFRAHRPILNQVVPIERLAKLPKDTVVTAELLKAEGLISSIHKPFKILGNAEIKKALIIQGGAISKSAKASIEKAGGKIELFDKKEKTEAKDVKAKAKDEKPEE